MKYCPISIIFSILFFTTGCKEFKFMSFQNDNELLASVGDKELYLEDVKSIFTKNMSPEDSLALLNAHVNSWIKRTIKLQEAEKMFKEKQEDIELLVQDYRNALLTSKYNQAIASVVDTSITKEQIKNYYNANLEQFRLVGPIVKARIVAFPTAYRQQKKLKEIMLSQKEDDYYDLQDLVKKQSFQYKEFNTWVYFKDVLENIPFTDKEFDSFLSQNKFYQVGNDDIVYMMVILDYKKTGNYIPMEMVENTIRRAIVNKRLTDHIHQVDDSIYRQAMQEHLIKINVDSVLIRPDTEISQDTTNNK